MLICILGCAQLWVTSFLRLSSPLGRHDTSRMAIHLQGLVRKIKRWAQAFSRAKMRHSGRKFYLNLIVTILKASSYVNNCSIWLFIGWANRIKISMSNTLKKFHVVPDLQPTMHSIHLKKSVWRTSPTSSTSQRKASTAQLYDRQMLPLKTNKRKKKITKGQRRREKPYLTNCWLNIRWCELWVWHQKLKKAIRRSI